MNGQRIDVEWSRLIGLSIVCASASLLDDVLDTPARMHLLPVFLNDLQVISVL
jgi:hypothetical protein